MPQLGSSSLGSATATDADAVQTVVDLLSNNSGWTNTDPEVFRHEELSQQQKENNPDPAIYVWSPVDATLDKFSADGDTIDERRTVEAQIWDLDSSNRAEQYHQDVIDFINAYSNDNESNTPFHFLKPVSATDSRSDHIRQLTDHYILSVEIEVHNHRDT
jgi:hypothetical protein